LFGCNGQNTQGTKPTAWKQLVERHRMVNTALAPHMAEIHAVSLKKALIPAQAQPQTESAATDKAQP
jgi:BolA protein